MRTKVVINEIDKFLEYYKNSTNDNFVERGFFGNYKIIKVNNSIDNEYEDVFIEGCCIHELYFLMNEKEIIFLPIETENNWKSESFSETLNINFICHEDKSWIDNIVEIVNSALIDYDLTVRKVITKCPSLED